MIPSDVSILAIDDNPDNLVTLKAVISDAFPSMRVLCAESGPRGLAIARSEDPAVILLDIIMPGMDGFDVCKAIKEDKKLRHIPVVFLTALKAEKEIRVRALESGGEGFLSKPIDSVELTAQIRAMVKIKAASLALYHENERLETEVLKRTQDLNRELNIRQKAEETLQKANTALREATLNWQAIFDSIKDPILFLDDTHTILDANTAAVESLGTTKEAMLGSKCYHILHGTNQPICNCPCEKALESNQVQSCDITTNGKAIELTAWPIQDDKGNTKSLIHILKDITEKKKTDEALQRAEKLDSIGFLAGGIAHDFNNLLCGMFGYLDMAKEMTPVNSKALRYLDKATSVFARAQGLTQQLLTFSKGGAPKLQTGYLNKIIQDTVCFVLSGTKIARELSISEKLPLCDFDGPQIGQVISNLLINAQQAMPEGGIISVTGTSVDLVENEIPPLAPGTYIHISISDSGPGIPAEHMNNMFVPFFTTKPKGNGLGLSTCYSIMTRHKGTITVESPLGKGATFHLYLPMSSSSITEISRDVVSRHLGNGSIIIMDDEEYIHETLGNMLHSMGYTVTSAWNGDETLSLAAELFAKGINLKAILLDLTIPGGRGGRETINDLRSMYPDLPIFAVSGYANDPVIAEPTVFGFTDSLRKPFRETHLAELFNHHFSKISSTA